jgi:hypothetical protein
MAVNPPIAVRLRPVIVSYLDELGAMGAYGKGRAGVMRRFIENGIVRAIERNTIEKKNAADFGESTGGDEDEDED